MPTHPRELAKILTHLIAVDNGGNANVNQALRRAVRLPRNPGPDLYWCTVGPVGCFYAREGTQTVVVHATTITAALPPYYSQASLRVAEGRM
jgi:hypothetical protein